MITALFLLHRLVASDTLARGIDVPNVTMVISYEPPKFVQGYVHRIGRTGRAGETGLAVSILVPNQTASFVKMLKTGRKEIPKIKAQDLSELAESVNYEDHLQSLTASLEKEGKKGKARNKTKKS